MFPLANGRIKQTLAHDHWSFNIQCTIPLHTCAADIKQYENQSFFYENMVCVLPRRTCNCECVHGKFLTHVKHPSTAHMLPKWLAATVEIVQLA